MIISVATNIHLMLRPAANTNKSLNPNWTVNEVQVVFFSQLTIKLTITKI